MLSLGLNIWRPVYGGASLPAGAIGAWYADGYSAVSRPHIPNAVDPSSLVPSLFMAPSRQFTNTEFWNNSGATITDANATGPDGQTNSASTFVGAGGWQITHASGSSVPLAAATYTLAISVRWKGTGNPDFQMGNYPTLTTFTSTASWQRFSMQFTLVSGNAYIIFYAPGGSSTCNFEIAFFDLFAGSSDLRDHTKPLASHIMLGDMRAATKPTVTGGAVDFSTGGKGVIQLPAATTLTDCTAIFVWSRVGNGFNAAYNPICTHLNNWSSFALGGNLGNNLGPLVSGASPLPVQQNANLFDPIGGGFAVGAQRWTASSGDCWINDIKMPNGAGIGSATIADLAFGYLQDLYYSGNKIAALELYDRKLTDAEVASCVTRLKTRVATSGITADPQKFYFAAGDSITYGAVGTPGYIGAMSPSTKVRGWNFGVGGQTIAGATAVASTVDAVLPAAKAGRKFILHMGWGANDLGIGAPETAATFTTKYTSYATARRSAGWDKLCSPTILPRTDQADSGVIFNTQRSTVNTNLSGLVGSTIDAISGFAADATMGPDAASNNATYYDSKLHPTTAGHAILAPIEAATVDSL